MITTKQAIEVYGMPNQTGTYLTSIKLPYPMKLAWDLKVTIKTIRVHKDLAEKFTKVFEDILAAYGLEEIQKLGIDLFGGTFAYRQMRGGAEWSRHAFGIAIDLDPARNGLKQSKKSAQFAKPEYKKLIDIFYANGFVNLGVEKDYDYMHFEIAK